MKRILLYCAWVMMLALIVPSAVLAQCASSYPQEDLQINTSYCITICQFDAITLQIAGLDDGTNGAPILIFQPGCSQLNTHCTNNQCTPIDDVPTHFTAHWNTFPDSQWEYSNDDGNCLVVLYHRVVSHPGNYWKLDIFNFCETGCFCLTFDRQEAAEVTSFEAIPSTDAITLRWSTASETNSSWWVVKRSESETGNQSVVAQLPAQGNSTTQMNYSWVDEHVISGKDYYYQLSEIDINGNASIYGTTVHASILNGNGSIPSQYALNQNYPNPFNPTTTFEFSLANPGFASLKIYDLSGREVATVIEGDLSAQTYHATWSGANLSSGVYFYTLKTNGYTNTKKLMLLK